MSINPISRFSFFCLIGICSTVVSTAKTQRPADVGAWYMHFTTIALGKPWSLHLENQYRAYDAIDLEQSLNRVGLNYHFDDLPLVLTQGYGYIYSEPIIGNDPDNQDSVNEHRGYQQFLYKHGFGPLKISHRGRLEERWIEEDFQLRARYFISGDLPLFGRNMEPSTLYLSVYNEIFMNLQGKGFDRNRIYGGIGYVLNDSCRVQLGFLRQVLRDVSASTNHINLSFHLNL